eukprot:6479-Heterococcus_DN1.PRE.1
MRFQRGASIAAPGTRSSHCQCVRGRCYRDAGTAPLAAALRTINAAPQHAVDAWFLLLRRA